METIMQKAPLVSGSTCWKDSCSVSWSSGSPFVVHCVSGNSAFPLKCRGGCLQLGFRADRSNPSCYISSTRWQGLVVRALQPSGVEEEEKEHASDEAVEGQGIVDGEVKVKADEMTSANHAGSGDTPEAAELLLRLREVEDKAAEDEGLKTGKTLEVASDSAVEDGPGCFQDVSINAGAIAGNVGRSVEDTRSELEEEAEDLEERQQTEADLLNEGEFEGTGQVTERSSSRSGKSTPLGRVVETLQDGFEILKWAGEGAVYAWQNSGPGIEVAKELIDKRRESVNIAADDTKKVTKLVVDFVQTTFQQSKKSAVQFGEEFQINVKEKDAADSLKPESKKHPVLKVGQGLQEKLAEATAEDSPLAKIGRSVSDNISVATAKSSEKWEEFSSKFPKEEKEFGSNVSNATDKNEGEKEEVISKEDGS